MAASPNGPLLALPSGSILQFLFMTLPLLGVYLYFLYLAYDRPNIANPNNPKYALDRIRLMDILLTYLVTLIPFSTLIVYMLWFVNQRHTLSKRYENEAISILGNVHYNESYYIDETINEAWRETFTGQVKHTTAKLWAWLANGLTLRNNYGYVEYDLSRVANHPACNYEDRPKNKRKNKLLVGTITKKVRVYHRYPREQVSILVLPDYPYSGQPKIDMEADWASFAKYVGLSSSSGVVGNLTDEEIDEVVEDPLRRKNNDSTTENDASMTNSTAFKRVFSRDRSRGVLLVAIFWVIFLVLASLFVVHQIIVVDEYYADEDGKSAWMAFWIIACGVTPAVACGGNWMRWKMYERWILRSGSKSKGARGSAKKDETVDYDDENRGGSYIQMN